MRSAAAIRSAWMSIPANATEPLRYRQTNPYFTDDGISRSYEVFLRTTRPPEVNTGDYMIRTTGANVKFGVPFSELDTVYFGAGIEQTKVETSSVVDHNDSPELYRQYVTDFGNAAGINDPGTHNARTNSLPLTVAWQRDSRDSALVPSVGRLQRVNFEFAPLGNLNYYRATYQHQYFKPMFQTVTLALNGQVDYGRSMGGKPYPVFKNYYAGGIGSVRGYEGSSLGPRASNGDPLGGTSRIFANAELQFPFPGFRQRSHACVGLPSSTAATSLAKTRKSSSPICAILPASASAGYRQSVH